MPFQGNWIFNPAIADDNDLAILDPLPTYRKLPDAGVGDKVELLVNSQVTAEAEVDPDVWAETAEQQPLVSARRRTGEEEWEEIWIERASLADPAYKDTVTAAKAQAQAYDEETVGSFWAGQREQYNDRTGQLAQVIGTTTVAHPTRPVQYPPGFYEVLGTDGRTFPEQLEPFTVRLKMPDGARVLVAPSRVVLDEAPGESDDQDDNAASTLTAGQITSPFTSLPVAGRYVPDRSWLTDDHVHYVTRNEMGAVFVLKAMPVNPAQITGAQLFNPELFESGYGTPGLRIGDHVFIQRRYRDTGVEYHEAMHRLSHPAVRAVLGFDFNEGLTEYFTRQLLATAALKGKVTRDVAQYQAQLEGVNELVSAEAATEEALAAAYFAGQLQPLFTNVATRLGPGFSLQGYAVSIGIRDHIGAQRLLADLAARAQ